MNTRMQRCENTEALSAYTFIQGLHESREAIELRAEQRDRIFALADSFLKGNSHWFNGERWCHTDVFTELSNHPLFDHCMHGYIIGDEQPLKDLTLRVARALAASLLKIDADSVGIIV